MLSAFVVAFYLLAGAGPLSREPARSAALVARALEPTS